MISGKDTTPYMCPEVIKGYCGDAADAENKQKTIRHLGMTMTNSGYQIDRKEFSDALERINVKLDGVKEDVSSVKEEMVAIKTTLKLTPIPKQPCPHLEKHLELHESIKMIWLRAVVSSVVSSVAASVTAALTAIWFFLRDK